MGTAGGAAVASAPLLRPRFTCSRGGRRGGSVEGQFSTAHWLAPPASDVMSRLCASGPRSGTSALSRPWCVIQKSPEADGHGGGCSGGISSSAEAAVHLLAQGLQGQICRWSLLHSSLARSPASGVMSRRCAIALAHTDGV